MLSKIKYWFNLKNISINSPFPLSQVSQEDPRTVDSIKRVNKLFDNNWEILNSRALVAHSFNCKDELTCSGCWQFVPDEIVSEAYVVEPFKRYKEIKKVRTRKIGTKNGNNK